MTLTTDSSSDNTGLAAQGAPLAERAAGGLLALACGDALANGVQLRLRVSRGLAEVLFNRPIGTGQTLTPCDLQPERFIVTTDIEASPQLRKWLARRIGDEVEIVEPQDLLERSD